MPAIAPYPPESATGDRRALLKETEERFGGVANLFATVAHSPAALRSMLGSFSALAEGRIEPALAEQIAVAVANYNECEYCLSAHTFLGRKAGVSFEALESARIGVAESDRPQAALDFALKLVENRGQVSASDIDELQYAGFDDEETLEIIAHVALSLFTNYVNVALNVEVDFPRISPSKRVAA